MLFVISAYRCIRKRRKKNPIRRKKKEKLRKRQERKKKRKLKEKRRKRLRKRSEKNACLLKKYSVLCRKSPNVRI